MEVGEKAQIHMMDTMKFLMQCQCEVLDWHFVSFVKTVALWTKVAVSGRCGEGCRGEEKVAVGNSQASFTCLVFGSMESNQL